MKKNFIIAASIMAVYVIHYSAVDSKENPVSSEESDRIVKVMHEKGIELYKKYRGVESVRNEFVKEYTSKSKQLKCTYELTVRRKDYFYMEPVVEVLSVKKDGVVIDPSKHRSWKSKPAYPVFDEKGLDNYIIQVSEKKKINGVNCYRIQVAPKKETIRHFKGSIYVTVDKLETVCIEGTVGKLEFPLKEFQMEFYTVMLRDMPVLKTGEVVIRINVPIFYPDTLVVSTFNVIEAKLIE